MKVERAKRVASKAIEELSQALERGHSVPPMLEEALGYRGALRFVEFEYSRTIRQFTYSDGGDSIPMLAFVHIRLRMGCVDGERKSCHFAKPHKS